MKWPSPSARRASVVTAMRASAMRGSPDKSGCWSRLAAVPARDMKSPTLSFDFEVAERAAHWLSLVPWVGWPIGLIALFLAHQCLVANLARKQSFPAANHELGELR
jgi:hypothetical protein